MGWYIVTQPQERTNRRLVTSLGIPALLLGLTLSYVTPAYADTTRLSGSSWLNGQGVDVYGGGDGSWNYVNGVQSGFKWQCVELINRLYLTKGWISARWTGNGNTLVNNVPSGLVKQNNGSITYLNPGDVVTMNDNFGGAGHAAIVNTVSGSSVQVVNQNTQAVYGNATFSNGSITSWLSNYTVQAVVHAPAASETPGPDFTPGIVRAVSGDWQWHLRNSNSGGVADVSFGYGVSTTDIPLPGDWDGDGDTTAGVVRRDGAGWRWLLHNNNAPGAADISFIYGLYTDIPVVGDWDGNGTVTPGVVRRNGAGWQWHLRNSNSGGSANISFAFGVFSTDTPVTGDWDGDGDTTIGIYREDGAGWQWHLRNGNSGGAANYSYLYGLSSTDEPLVGDWDGDGDTTPGVIRPDGAGWQWHLRNSNSGGAANYNYVYGLTASDSPITGDWDGS
jgi:hypothetical protein